MVAYDDSVAICVRFPCDIACAVPADLTLKLLNSLTHDEIYLTHEDSHVLVSCGSSRLKVPALSPKSFIFDQDEFGRKRAELQASKEFLDGLDQCLISVGSDPTHAAQMGITVVGDANPSADRAVLYSTDNVTMSRVHVKAKFPSEPIVLPTEFCRHLLSLSKAYNVEHGLPAITLHEACIVARFGESVLLYSKLLSNDKPLDFAAVFRRFLPDDAEGTALPAGWESVFNRACAVVNPARPLTEVSAEGKTVTIVSKSLVGEAYDELRVDSTVKTKTFLIDPQHVLRASKACDEFYFAQAALVLSNGTFTHLITHCQE